MHALEAYKQQRTLGWTKIDMVLALQGKAIERIEAGLAALARGQRNEATAMFARAQLAVHGLCCGLDLTQGELAWNQQRLYEFTIHVLKSADPTQVQAALQVLHTLRTGFEAVRDEAARFEENMRDSLIRRTA